MSLPDWVILITYLAGVLAIGVIAARSIQGTDHYFLGSRRFASGS